MPFLLRLLTWEMVNTRSKCLKRDTKAVIQIKKVVWVPYNKFVQGDDFETPVRYAVDESSIDARNEFKCEN